MIWTYRAINNPVAKRKWLVFCLILILLGFGYTANKIVSGEPYGKSLIIAGIFALFISLYTIIALGKPRHYFIEGDFVVYKPFKTNLKKIKGFEVDESGMVIRLKTGNPFSVRTLYFENPDELKKVERMLERITGSRR
jgi:hypothetical protein